MTDAEKNAEKMKALLASLAEAPIDMYGRFYDAQAFCYVVRRILDDDYDAKEREAESA